MCGLGIVVFGHVKLVSIDLHTMTLLLSNKEEVVRPVVTRHGEGVKNVRLVPKGEERRFERDNMLRIQKVEVSVGRKPKVRRLVEGVGGDLGVSREEGKGIVGKIMERKGTSGVKVKERLEGKELAADAKDMESPSKNTFHFLPVYNSKVEDRKWATSGMIATVHDGDWTLALQQCVEDASF